MERLPIYLPSGLKIKYIWHPGLIYPYESAWSILHKFCSWNAVSRLEGNRLFGLKTKREQDALKGHIRVFNSKIESFLIINYLINNEILGHINDLQIDFPIQDPLEKLKFKLCERCMENDGYHSVFHQVNGLDYCIFHGGKLQSTCKSCDNDLSPSIENVYSCKCGERFYNDCTTEYGENFISMIKEKADGYLKWKDSIELKYMQDKILFSFRHDANRKLENIPSHNMFEILHSLYGVPGIEKEKIFKLHESHIIHAKELRYAPTKTFNDIPEYFEGWFCEDDHLKKYRSVINGALNKIRDEYTKDIFNQILGDHATCLKNEGKIKDLLHLKYRTPVLCTVQYMLRIWINYWSNYKLHYFESVVVGCTDEQEYFSNSALCRELSSPLSLIKAYHFNGDDDQIAKFYISFLSIILKEKIKDTLIYVYDSLHEKNGMAHNRKIFWSCDPFNDNSRVNSYHAWTISTTNAGVSINIYRSKDIDVIFNYSNLTLGHIGGIATYCEKMKFNFQAWEQTAAADTNKVLQEMHSNEENPT